MSAPSREILDKLSAVNWNFKHTNTNYSTHNLHPFPAKFIPQIPQRLIQLFTSEGDVVFDPFCGSGTTIVEAVRMGRKAIGFDINPLAVLISKAKATPIEPTKLRLTSKILDGFSKEIYGQAELGDFCGRRKFSRQVASDYKAFVPNYEKLDFWFQDSVIKELAIIKKFIQGIDNQDIQDLLKLAFSSIIISVSRQDSETRYVRREKHIKPGDVFSRFLRQTERVLQALKEYSISSSGSRPQLKVWDAREIEKANLPEIDLVVSSTPYPNAFTYHLYHRNRLVWLDFDYDVLRRKEIGSHREYSKPNGATPQIFKEEMKRCFRGIAKFLRPGGICCFVIGDSIIRGKLIKNWVILREAAKGTGLSILTKIQRSIEKERKSLNVKIGRISEEEMVFFRRE